MPFEFSERPALYNLSPLERFNLIKEKQSLRKEKYFKLKRAQYILHKDHNKEILDRIYENVKNYEKKASSRKPLLLSNGKRETSPNEEQPSSKRLKKSGQFPSESKNSSFAISVNLNYDDIIDEENKKASENSITSDILKGKYTASNSSSDITMAGSSTIGKIEPSMKILPSNGFTFAKRDLSNLVQANEESRSTSSNSSLFPHKDTTVTPESLSTAVETSSKPKLFVTETKSTATATDVKKPAFTFGSTLSENKNDFAKKIEREGEKVSLSSKKPLFASDKSQFASNSPYTIPDNKAEEKTKKMTFSFGASSNNTNDEKNKKRSRDNEETETKSSEKKALCSFNLESTVGSGSSIVSNTENENRSSKPEISFTSKKDESFSKKPLFSFDKAKTAEQGNQNLQGANESAKPFSFGSFGKQSETNPDEPKSTKITSSNFSFGTTKPGDSTIFSSKPSFSFGLNKQSEDDKKETKVESTTTFGSIPIKENESINIKFTTSRSSEPAPAAKGFVFGSLSNNEKSTSSPSTNKGFNFGKNPTISEAPNVLDKSKQDPTKPLFSFGSQQPSNTTTPLFGASSDNSTSKENSSGKLKFSFNSSGDGAKESTNDKKKGFTFGSLADNTNNNTQTNGAPKFTFGQASATPMTKSTSDVGKPAFSFGGLSSNTTALSSEPGPKTNSMFSFSYNKEDPKKTKLFSSLGGEPSSGTLFGGNNNTVKKKESGTGFSFNSNALNKKETTPSSSFSFGAQNSSNNNAGFNFGSNNANNGSMFTKKPETQATNAFGNSSSNSSFNGGMASTNNNNNNNNGSSGFTFGNASNNNNNNGSSGFTFGNNNNNNNNNNGFTFSASSSRSTTPAANFGTTANANANGNLFGNNNKVFGSSSSPAPAGPFGAANNNIGFGKSPSPATMGSGFGMQNTGSAGGFGGNNGSNSNSFNFGNSGANNGAGGFNFGASTNNSNSVSFTFTGAGSNNSASIDPSSIFNNSQQTSGEGVNGRKLLVPKRRARR